jgi:RNA polymerase sigma-70 factor (ECF subfamily)
MLANFHEIYERYSPTVYRFALTLSGDRTAAEDLVSETFLRAWASPRETRLATVRAYLLTITRNVYLNGLRSVKPMEAVAETVPDPSVPPDERMAQRMRLEAVLRGLQQLPEIDRAALILRTLDELSYEEIGSILKISVAAAKVKVHRARLRLLKSERSP